MTDAVESIMALADNYADNGGPMRLRNDLRAAVERVIRERDDNETECNVHAACTRLQRERAEYAERQLKVWESAANDHYQRAERAEQEALAAKHDATVAKSACLALGERWERAEAERDALKALLVEARDDVASWAMEGDDESCDLLGRITAALDSPKSPAPNPPAD